MLLKVTIMHESISQIWLCPKIWNPEILNRPFHIPENLREYCDRIFMFPFFLKIRVLAKIRNQKNAGWLEPFV